MDLPLLMRGIRRYTPDRARLEWTVRGAPLLAKGLEHSGSVSAFGSTVEFDSYRTMRYLVREVFLGRTYDVGNLPSQPTIVDCGANVGVATWFFHHRYPGCQVLAVEPAPRSFELLKRNVERNKWNCEVYKEASSDVDGSTELFIKPQQLTTPSASVVAGRFTGGDVVSVPCRRLSTRLPETTIDLLKLDVEGAEWAVLDDLDESGSFDRIERMAIEYHHHLPGQDDFPRFLERLQRAGYIFSLVASGSRENPTTCQDVMIYAGRATPVGP